jgi:hypothetical protein
MSDTLKIAGRCEKKTCQDAPGTTIGITADLQVYPSSGSRIITGMFSGLNRDGNFRADEEGVDADVPVDAKNASTSDFENCRQFSTAPTPNLFFFKEERTTKNGRQEIA